MRMNQQNLWESTAGSCIKGENSLQSMLRAVSYTHLDVYKRQKLSIITKEKESDILIKELHKEFII